MCACLRIELISDNVLQGGFGTYDEMCLVFLNYYPRVPLSGCTSRPSVPDMLTAMGIKVDTIDPLALYVAALRLLGTC